jgi:uncharacterized iron-regulated membrane protein
MDRRIGGVRYKERKLTDLETDMERERGARMRRTIYKLHKWIAVTVGAFILLWLISGIVMVLPKRFPPPSRQAPAPLDLREITISPAEAVVTLSKVLGSSPEVGQMTLRRLGNSVVYEISAKPGGSHFVDARSGEIFTITPDVAEQIAQGDLHSQARALQIEIINQHALTYPWGPLPAYRVVFDDDRATISYVSTRDGRVWHTDRRSRIRVAMSSLHDFSAFRLIIGRNAVRTGLLLLLSLVGIAVVVTGYYLALPRRWVS